jgi:hypothetical protein
MAVPEYDVFISYRWVSPDQEWVRDALVPALRAARLRTCLDVEDFVPGRDVILEMTRAGQSSRTALCIISPDYFDGNRMAGFEALLARRLDPSGQESRLIPLLLRPAERPDWMRGLVAVDWTDGRAHRREWTKLLRVLRAPLTDTAPPRALDASSADRAVPAALPSARPEASHETPPAKWKPNLIFIKVNPRVLKPYAQYVALLLAGSGAALQFPALWERLPFVMDHISQVALQEAKPALMTSVVCSVAGIVLLITMVSGLLNMQLLFSSVKVFFLLALFSFLCGVVTLVSHESMVPHIVLALLLIVAFTRHFFMGSLRYYLKRRSFGDAIAETILLITFVVLIWGPLRTAF